MCPVDHLQLPRDLLLQEEGVRRPVEPSGGVHLLKLEDQVVEDGSALAEPQEVGVLRGHRLVVQEVPWRRGASEVPPTTMTIATTTARARVRLGLILLWK